MSSSSLPEVPLSEKEATQPTTLTAADDAAPERVIIDTDPGIDDTMALFLALSNPHRLRIVRFNIFKIDKIDYLIMIIIFNNIIKSNIKINASHV
jgi:hypothetical protein